MRQFCIVKEIKYFFFWKYLSPRDYLSYSRKTIHFVAILSSYVVRFCNKTNNFIRQIYIVLTHLAGSCNFERNQWNCCATCELFWILTTFAQILIFNFTSDEILMKIFSTCCAQRGMPAREYGFSRMHGRIWREIRKPLGLL